MHPYIEIFGRQLPSYGMFLGLGALTAVLLAVFVTRRKYAFDFVDYVFLLLWIFGFGLAGAKLLYLIVELDAFIARPELWLSYLRGGGVFYGGLLGGLLGAYLCSRRNGWNYLACLDTCAAPICFAHALGRAGCYMGGCCYGAPTHSGWGVIYPEGGAAPAGVPLLPTQLFEAAFLLLLGASLLIVLKKSKKTGLSAAVYMIAYGIWRFFIEFLRSDDRGTVGMLSTSQFISVFIILAGAALLLFQPRLETFFDSRLKKKK